jgi:hypothetical protein
VTNQDFNQAVDRLREEIAKQVNNALDSRQNNEMDLLLSKISEQVQAELDRAAAERQRAAAEEELAAGQAELVEEAKRNRKAAERRHKITQDVLDRYAYLARQLELLIPMLTLLETAMRDYFEESADKLEFLSEQITLLTGLEIAEARGDKRTKDQLLDEIVELPQRHKDRKLAEQYRKNIEMLEEQMSSYGALEIPLSLKNKLEAEKQRLKELCND